MKKNLLLIFVFVLLFDSLLQARSQNYLFNVLAVKGQVEIIKEKSKKYEKLNAGTKISVKDKIKLSGDSYLGLVYKNGRTIEVKQAGEYAASQLASTVSTGKSSMTSKLASFVVDQIKDSKGIIDQDNDKSNMEVTGAVERGLSVETPGGNTNKAHGLIKVLMPKKFNTISQEITVNWVKPMENATYKFVLSDRFDKQIFWQEVKGDNITLVNGKNINIKNDEYFFYKISMVGNENYRSDDYTFELMSPKKVNEFNTNLDNLKKELGDEKTALKQIVLASFYEQNNMIQDADRYYQLALKTEPDVTQYRQMYDSFKKKTNYIGH